MVVIAYGFRDTLREPALPRGDGGARDGTIELRRGADGHFHATLEVNGAAGALPGRHRRLGHRAAPPRRRGGRASTSPALGYIGRADDRERPGGDRAGPPRRGALRRASSTPTSARSVSAGGLDVSLLGMAYLDRFARIEIEGDIMRLRR